MRSAIAIASMLVTTTMLHAAPPEGAGAPRGASSAAASAARVKVEEKNEENRQDKPVIKAYKESAKVTPQRGKPQRDPE